TTDDQQLAELVEEITAKLQSGQSCDVEQYAARHPEYADRLRDWITVMSAMADLGMAWSRERGARNEKSPLHFPAPLDEEHPPRRVDSPPLPLGEGQGEGALAHTATLGDFRIF